MGTECSVAIRKKTRTLDEVFLFRALHDGYLVIDFCENNPSPASVDELIVNALRFFTQGTQGEFNRERVFALQDIKEGKTPYCRSDVLFSVEPYNRKTDYAAIVPRFSLYYDGNKWQGNLQLSLGHLLVTHKGTLGR